MSNKTHKFLLQHLSCFACREILSEPVLLPCLHLYCKKCLNAAFCPFCFRPTQVPPEVNYSLLILIQHLNEIDDEAFDCEYNGLMTFCELYSIQDKVHFLMMESIGLQDCFKASSRKRRKRAYYDRELVCQ